MFCNAIVRNLLVAAVAGSTVVAQAVNIDLVPVGNPGNAGECSGESYGGYGLDRICGAVGYAYNIGKYEVTAGQYTEFLNAVGGVDTYGLYNSHMWTDMYGCKIQRSGGGTTGNPYVYSVAANWSNRPVNHVSYGDAMRFTNWLHNGQPIGAQDTSTTEDGAYFVNGATTAAELLAVNRESDWKWAVTSEDEWYKAAYHKNDGVTCNYWDYPTGTNAVPSNVLTSPDPGNNGNFHVAFSTYTIGRPYYRTPVGEFENSESAYGTFDQGGNVWEWNESILYNPFRDHFERGGRGGSFNDNADNWLASVRELVGGYPTNESSNLGFRVASVPEPGSITLLLAGAISLIGYAWRRRKRR